MLQQFRLRPLYFMLSFIFLGCMLTVCLSFPKLYSFQLLNSFHNKWMDAFFVTWTNAGDGFVSIAVVLLLAIFKKWKIAITVLLAYISSGLFAQLLKNIFTEPRPAFYLQHSLTPYTHFIKGVILYTGNSFPSGHTASAFAMATVFSLRYCSRFISISAFLLAVLAGYSRIYLGEHFLQDVFAGALTGILFGMISYSMVYEQNGAGVLKRIRQKYFNIFRQPNDGDALYN